METEVNKLVKIMATTSIRQVAWLAYKAVCEDPECDNPHCRQTDGTYFITTMGDLEEVDPCTIQKLLDMGMDVMMRRGTG